MWGPYWVRSENPYMVSGLAEAMSPGWSRRSSYDIVLARQPFYEHLCRDFDPQRHG